jgi:hypothetical protein
MVYSRNVPPLSPVGIDWLEDVVAAVALAPLVVVPDVDELPEP